MSLPTREVYRDTLVELMQHDSRIFCLDSDTGLFNNIDFRAAHTRYVNLGIAEQNLMTVAAGLALAGKRPFVNTMATFASTRALEQLKIDIAYNNLPVRVIATHGGLSAGHLGPTHHALEDLAILRTLPNMTVIVPASATQAAQAITAAAKHDGPVYVRLGRRAEPIVNAGDFSWGRANVLRRGKDVAIFATGAHAVEAALASAETLESADLSVEVVNVPTIKPLDTSTILASARGRVVVTVEDHFVSGGLGSAIAELLAERQPTVVERVGVRDEFASHAGDHAWLLSRYGLSSDDVARAALAAISRQRHLLHQNVSEAI